MKQNVFYIYIAIYDSNGYCNRLDYVKKKWYLYNSSNILKPLDCTFQKSEFCGIYLNKVSIKWYVKMKRNMQGKIRSSS